MNNFIFKSASRLTKNSSIQQDNLMAVQKLLQVILKEQRHQRSDLNDLKLMVNKVLLDKHLQMEVDDFYEKQDGTVSNS